MRHRIIMRFKYLMYEGDYLRANLPETSTVVIARKESDKATAIPSLSFSIPLLPASLRADWNCRSVLCNLHLLFIMIVIRMNDPVTEHSSSQINITGAFKQISTFQRNARGEMDRGYNTLFILSFTLLIGTCEVSIAEHRSMPRL